MNKLLLLCLLMGGVCFGQKITVAEVQLKLDGNKTEEFMYGFAAGDRVIVTLQAQGATLGEASVLQYPDAVKYKGIDISQDKYDFTVTDKSVFVFRFVNTSKGKRTCNVTIQRVPKNSATKIFNTAVKWATVQDTVWTSLTKDVVVGYDTLHVQKVHRVVASEKKYEEVVLDKSQRVGAKSGFAGTKSVVQFTLPLNQVSKDETKKVVAWGYWVGVGEESNTFWKENRKMIIDGVKGVAAYYTTPVGGIAAGAVTSLLLPTSGEDVQYVLVDEANSKLFLAGKPGKTIDNGKGIAAYKRFIVANALQGTFYMVLANDNIIQPIDVNVKVSAIVEQVKYKDEKYMDTTIMPRYEKKIVREPNMVTVKKPVTFDYK